MSQQNEPTAPAVELNEVQRGYNSIPFKFPSLGIVMMVPADEYYDELRKATEQISNGQPEVISALMSIPQEPLRTRGIEEFCDMTTQIARTQIVARMGVFAHDCVNGLEIGTCEQIGMVELTQEDCQKFKESILKAMDRREDKTVDPSYRAD